MSKTLISPTDYIPNDGEIYGRCNKQWTRLPLDLVETARIIVEMSDGSSTSGLKVIINGIPMDYTGPIEMPFQQNVRYTVGASKKDGYVHPSEVTYVANQTLRIITLKYTKCPTGVYILGLDLNLYTADKWNNSIEAVGVYVGDSAGHRFIISPDSEVMNLPFGGYNKLISGIATTTASATAKTNYNGAFNTNEIVKLLKGFTDSLNIKESPSCNYCVDYTFKDGRKGYLGACGEWLLAYNNKAAINLCMNKINGLLIHTNTHIQTSTQYNINNVWTHNWGNGAINYVGKNSASYYVRAFAEV